MDLGADMSQVRSMTLYSLAGLTGLGFVFGLVVWAVTDNVNPSAMMVLALLTLLWFGLGFVSHRIGGQSGQLSASTGDHKAKRDGSDMYSIIDRLVYELTPDERSYLQRRLDETAYEDDGQGDLSTTLESLLSKREDHLSS
jgi:hypothetical protein